MVDKKAMLVWCDSVQKTWEPVECAPRSLRPRIPEAFLATAIRYIRALCEEQGD